MGVKGIIKSKVRNLKFFKAYFDIVETKIPLSFKQYIKYKLKKKHSNIYWPVHKNSIVSGNVKIGINSSVGATPGCYIQGIGEVIIGDYTILAPNVGIISSNHDLYDYRVHHKERVIIGNYCWIGMNAVVLPGVVLGNHTIVAAGAVVTKSFEEGYCVIGGNPAKIIKILDRELTIDYKDEHEYYGYIPKSEFKGIH
ncbi:MULTISPECIES: acyltransferase [Bacillus cereus group]|uniref:acyltransferase n=1 Tax=Bacillus cereus group TaxID=86661 RepID=UPI0010FFA264|nr:acyltransferase [Bacillus paranthracis]MED1610727.1 acyltransferase [Bacillus paranthracis]MED1683886.1 acyltransferase [Bacillus paranthracis]QCU08442.1 acyltransferase [Bacillus paranthracis]HDR7280161.1 acyltransferase [Bacillus paranthracis]